NLGNPSASTNFAVSNIVTVPTRALYTIGVLPDLQQVFVVNSQTPDPLHPPIDPMGLDDPRGLTATIPVDGAPRSVVFSPDGSRAYVSLSFTNNHASNTGGAPPAPLPGEIAVIDTVALQRIDPRPPPSNNTGNNNGGNNNTPPPPPPNISLAPPANS